MFEGQHHGKDVYGDSWFLSYEKLFVGRMRIDNHSDKIHQHQKA